MSVTPHKFKSVGRFTVKHIRTCLTNMSYEECLAALRIMSPESLAYLSQHKDERGSTFIQNKIRYMVSNVTEAFEMIKLLENLHVDQYEQKMDGRGILKILIGRAWFVNPEDRTAFLEALDYLISRTDCKNHLDYENQMQSFLHTSVIEGDVEVTQLLLRHGLDPNATDSDGFTPDDYAMYSDPRSATEQTPVRNFYTSYLAIKNSLSLESQAAQLRNRVRI